MLKVDNVEKYYSSGGMFSREKQQILKQISFEVSEGECLGIIGESGSGKSTLGRLIVGIEQPDRGTVSIDGKNIKDRAARVGNISAVFQDYTSSINPFFTVEDAIIEPLNNQNKNYQENRNKIDRLLHQVGLHPSYRTKYPHELSGGEAQRVCIARAISTEPKYILLDEAISSLDISVQTQVLDLLKQLKQQYTMSYLFITHDIQAATYICDRVIIIRNGQIEETVAIGKLKDVGSEYAKELLDHLITL